MQLIPIHAARPSIRRLLVAALALALPMAGPAPLQAQGLFAPAIIVNDDVITTFELEQRTQLLRLLRAPGDPVKLAREALIDDRLKQQAVKAADIEISPEDVQAGIEEFSARTQLSADEFLNALEEGGVSAETMRDFTKVSLAWREFIRARFLARARPTDAEIDRAIGQAGGSGGVRVLLSEIVIPITPQTAEEVDALAQEISQVTSIAAFSEAAQQYSVTNTRDQGGRMEWVNINDLPPGLRPVILGLSPGQVTAPIGLPEAIALFQLRDIQETAPAEPSYSAIEFVSYFIAGGRSEAGLREAARVVNLVDACDDFYGIARGQPPEVLVRETLPPAQIPRDVALELAKLDPGEVSTALTRSNGQTLMVLMMCGRTAAVNEDASREEVANALAQQRLAAFSQSYLDQLRADAVIVER